MEEDEQRLRVRLVGSDGRRRYDPASVDRLVAPVLNRGSRYRGLRLNTALMSISCGNGYRGPSGLVILCLRVRRSFRFRSVPMDTRIERLSPAAKLSASLPNGVSVTVECSDVDGLTAIIGALGHVQTGR